jgi:hypothetical protein
MRYTRNWLQVEQRGTQELATVTNLLREVIDSITESFQEQLRSEPVPDVEAATLPRLINL